MKIYTDNSQVVNEVQKIPTKLNEIISMIVEKVSDILNAPTMQQVGKIDWSDISEILGTISIILIITMISLIALYILKSVGLYTMAKKSGRNFAWIAFIPFGCLFSYGLISGKTKLFGIEVDHPEFVLPALLLSSWLPYIGCLSTVLFIITYFAMLYKVYESRTPNFATVLLILSIILPILSPIVLFGIRNK